MQFSNLSVKRFFKRWALPLLSTSLLLFILIKEGYVQMLKDRLLHSAGIENEQAYNYNDNEYYQEQTDFYSLYNCQKNIVMLGNSLTFRIHWSELLERQDVANRGIGSDITAGFLHRLQSIVAVNPKICFIEGGLNDVFHGIPVDSSLTNLSRLADSLQRYGIKVSISTVTYIAPFHKKARKYNPVIKKLNEGILVLVREKNLYLIDLNPSIAENDQLKSEYVLKDGVHLTSKAYRIWKLQVENILKKENI